MHKTCRTSWLIAVLAFCLNGLVCPCAATAQAATSPDDPHAVHAMHNSSIDHTDSATDSHCSVDCSSHDTEISVAKAERQNQGGHGDRSKHDDIEAIEPYEITSVPPPQILPIVAIPNSTSILTTTPVARFDLLRE